MSPKFRILEMDNGTFQIQSKGVDGILSWLSWDNGYFSDSTEEEAKRHIENVKLLHKISHPKVKRIINI